jgi:DNA-binding XRE family transcriptional regulator
MEHREWIPHEELLDEVFGKPGTATREAHERSIELWLVGRKIREIREAKKLTQEDLGKLIGVQKAQISKIENGKNLTLETITRVFKALAMEARIHINQKGLDIALS